MAQGQRAEPLGERDLPAVVQALAAQEDHLVVQEGLADVTDLLVGELVAEIDTADLGSDESGDPAGPDLRGASGAGFLGQGHDADASWTTVLKRESNWLAASICLGMIWAS